MSDAEWENLPEVGNLTGKKRKRDPREGRAFVVPDSVLIGDRDRDTVVNHLDEQQQLNGGFDTPAGDGDGALTNLVAIGQARDNLLSLKLDQVCTFTPNFFQLLAEAYAYPDFRLSGGHLVLHRSERLPHRSQ